ncbi:hypothetical protein VNO77_41852 [Canavalia gladiata]|uniref:Uncharacterized protein n=1 Tax=Canavalia gladiata TaxID=3824 RepID=A0AAN9JZM0_CANGL
MLWKYEVSELTGLLTSSSGSLKDIIRMRFQRITDSVMRINQDLPGRLRNGLVKFGDKVSVFSGLEKSNRKMSVGVASEFFATSSRLDNVSGEEGLNYLHLRGLIQKRLKRSRVVLYERHAAKLHNIAYLLLMLSLPFLIELLWILRLSWQSSLVVHPLPTKC